MGSTDIIVGLEYTPFSLRAARTEYKKTGGDTAILLEDIEELTGDFTKESELVKALKEIKIYMSKAGTPRFNTCISGKQVYAAELEFQKLPPSEMKDALRFEIKKLLPFDISTSTIDYHSSQSLVDKENPKRQIAVTAVSNALLKRHLQILKKADIKPDIVDVLPFAVSNVLWAAKGDIEEGTAGIVLYLEPKVCTLVVDGVGCRFFNRSIYFNAKEVLKNNDDIKKDGAETTRKIEAFVAEVVRTISFYRQTYSVSSFENIYVVGEYAEHKELKEILSRKTGLNTEEINLAKMSGAGDGKNTSKFDIAIALSMRTDFV